LLRFGDTRCGSSDLRPSKVDLCFEAVGIRARGVELFLRLTTVPSSKKTPVTRPVIFAAMVARRRGVT